MTGGAEGGRTPDLLNAIQAFSQLNYGPILISTRQAISTGRLFRDSKNEGVSPEIGLISISIRRNAAKYLKKEPGPIYPGSFPGQVNFRCRYGCSEDYWQSLHVP